MVCNQCNQSLRNTYLLGGCNYISKLGTSRHNITFKLLHDLQESNNGGRWPIISMGLEKLPINDFKLQIQIKVTPPQGDHSLQALEATQEGLPNPIKTQTTTIPQTRHHYSHRAYTERTRRPSRKHHMQRETMFTTDRE